MHSTSRTFTILGAGSWGTALALHLSRLGESVYLWTHEKDHVDEMIKEGVNKRYLPEQLFPLTLKPIASLTEACEQAADILIAVPSVAFRETLTQLQPLLRSHHKIISATKGLDEKTGQLLHETTSTLLKKDYPYAVLSGPSFAKEVAAGLPTAVVIASQNISFAHSLIQRFNSPTFRVYLSTDIPGVEVGGVVKNVLAIATGISDGMGFGANARCALITRGLIEIIRFGSALGGQWETFNGLTGLGDLVLTCTDDQSRNRRFGILIGQGQSVIDAENKIGQVVEGKRNASLIMQLAEKNKVDMPIVAAVSKVLESKMTPLQAMQELLARAPKTESQ